MGAGGGGICRCCLEPLFEWLILDDDTDLQIHRKRTAFWVYVGVIFTCAVSLAMQFGASDFYLVVMGITLVSCIAQLVWMLSTRTCSDGLVVQMTATGFFAAVGFDLNGSATGHRSWPLFIIAFDLILVMDGPAWLPNAANVVGVFWTILVSLEGSYRFGLFDAPLLTSQEHRYETSCGCEVLPCGEGSVSGALNYSLLALFVIVVDSFISRRFAQKVAAEVRTVKNAILTVESVAENLVDFDLETAAVNLQAAHGGIPDELFEHFGDLIRHLDMYRPYLPDSLFENDHSEASAGPVFSPEVMNNGAGEVQGAIVFTDIRSSSTIWKGCPEGMRKALRIHNKVIRKAIAGHNGYEVKTIGDAFMVAFTEMEDGVAFGLAVQEGLLNAHWPEDILHAPECVPQQDLWRGLAVRIGVAQGPVTVERNELTGRWDYFGHTVNVAARLESVAVVGSVSMLKTQVDSPELLHGKPVAQQWAMVKSAKTELKGVSDRVGLDVVSVVPAKLKGRKKLPYQICDIDANGEAERGSWGDSGSDSHSRKNSQNDEPDEPVVAGRRPRMSTRLSVGSATSGRSGRQRGQGRRPGAAVTASALTVAPSGVVGIIGFAAPDVGEFCDGAMVAIGHSRILQKVHIAIGRTSGAVTTLFGSNLMVSWGVVRRTATHLEDAVRFTELMREAAGGGLVGAPEFVLHIGMCAGPVFSGSVGGSQQRYMTILGPPVMHAMRLRLLAERQAAAADNRVESITTLITTTAAAHSPYLVPDLQPKLREEKVEDEAVLAPPAPPPGAKAAVVHPVYRILPDSPDGEKDTTNSNKLSVADHVATFNQRRSCDILPLHKDRLSARERAASSDSPTSPLSPQQPSAATADGAPSPVSVSNGSMLLQDVPASPTSHRAPSG
eukprot:TRINITY_DN2642_c0_g4_i1.p1 TRINITY_DN2642_c0_g4~~TRINITY_DN2642_c0_g4_i1.p1  ORF type:complete len:894 (+),score=234.54 TRINITY_DN2642_c0_g4_i1:87-2768(+)